VELLGRTSKGIVMKYKLYAKYKGDNYFSYVYSKYGWYTNRIDKRPKLINIFEAK